MSTFLFVRYVTVPHSYRRADIIRPHSKPPFPVREDKSVMAKTYHARAWHCSYSLLQLKGNFHLTKKQSENNAFNFANCLPDHNFPFSINKNSRLLCNRLFNNRIIYQLPSCIKFGFGGSFFLSCDIS